MIYGLHLAAWIAVAVFMQPGILMAIALIVLTNALTLWRGRVLAVLYAHLGLTVGVALAAIAYLVSWQFWSLLIVLFVPVGLYTVKPLRRLAGYMPFVVTFITACAAYFLAAEAIVPLVGEPLGAVPVLDTMQQTHHRLWYYLYWLLAPLVFVAAMLHAPDSRGETPEPSIGDQEEDKEELGRLKKAWGYFWR